MKFLSTLALGVVALQAGLGFADSIESMPSCGLACTIQLVPKSSCSLTNATCICTNVELNTQLSACVFGKCSIRDALTTKKYSDTTCNRTHVDNSLQIIVTTPLFGALALLFFLLRVAGRYCSGLKATWGIDDWIIVPTVMASIPMTVLSFILSKHGLGHDMWMVPFDDITYILYLYYWDEILYLFIIPAIKISMLTFYLRIFPGTQFRTMTFILIGVNVASFFAFELITIFQCTPIYGAWTHWDGESFSGTCRDVNLQAWVAAAVTIVLDVATIVLPMPYLWGLNLSVKKKLQVMLMFAVGGFVTVVSILRLQYLLQFAKTTNVTQDFVPVGVWSTVEVSVGIMCSCMPAIRSLFSAMAPKFFGSTQKSGYDSSRSKLSDFSSSRGAPKPIKVTSSFTVRSKLADESSLVELAPFETPFDSEDERPARKKPANVRESV